MEKTIKEIVKYILEKRLDKTVEISEDEWKTAVDGALQDVYINKYCMLKNADYFYFITVLVNLLAIMKRVCE